MYFLKKKSFRLSWLHSPLRSTVFSSCFVLCDTLWFLVWPGWSEREKVIVYMHELTHYLCSLRLIINSFISKRLRPNSQVTRRSVFRQQLWRRVKNLSLLKGLALNMVQTFKVCTVAIRMNCRNFTSVIHAAFWNTAWTQLQRSLWLNVIVTSCEN